MNKRVLFLIILFFGFNIFGLCQNTVYVKNINISGNVRTHTDIIIRELSFKQGDSLQLESLSERLMRSKQNIFNTNLFLSVDFNEEKLDNDLIISIIVKERWYFLAVPEIYLADRNFNEWWYDRGRDFSRITYGITAKHFNLTGNNDQLKIKVFGGFIPYYEVSYFRPYIDKRKRIGIRTGAFYSTQRSMPFRTWNDKLDFISTESRMRERKGGFFEFRLRNALYNIHSIYLGFSASKIADTIAVLNPNYFGKNVFNQKILSFVYDYRYDKRDNRQYPLKGNLFVTQLSEYITFGSKIQQQINFTTAYAKFLQISNKVYFQSSLKAKFSTPKSQYYTLIDGFGYGSSLVRGYELYVIDAQHTFLSRNTLKYQLLKRNFDLSKYIRIKQFSTIPIAMYPNVFTDFGYSKNYFPERSNTKLGNKLLTGVGVGLDIVTWYDTNFKMYYSSNHLGERKFFFSIYKDVF